MPSAQTLSRYLGSLLLAGAATLVAACATTSATTSQYVGGPKYPPSDASAVQIVRSEPSLPHDRLGEIVVDASVDPAPPITEVEDKLKSEAAKLGADAVDIVLDRVQPVAAYVTGPYWGRSIDTVEGRKLVGVATWPSHALLT